jgi:hypothetical protein
MVTRQIALGHGGGHIRDGAHLRSEIRRQLVHVVSKIAPDAGRTGHARLAAEFAFDADFARHGRHLIREDRQRIDHFVDGVGELGDFALRLKDQFAFEISVRHGGDDLGNTAHLSGQVRRHEVDVIGEIFPRARDAAHIGLAAQFTVGADFAGHARHFRSERIELIHHRVDGVLELQNFAARIHGDLARQVAVGHSRGDLRDVANLIGQVAAIELTLSVRSFHVPATPRTSA